MVEAAAGAGATHVKIQTIYSRNLVYRPEFEKGLKEGKKVRALHRPWAKEFRRLSRLELNPRICARFVRCCRENGVEPLTTCFARDTVAQIREQGFREIKVASYDCGSYQLLRELVAAGFHRIYVSTGATYPDELACSAKILHGSGVPYELLHCVTIYPTPLGKLNLSRMRTLQKWGAPVGFSDHTSSLKSRNLASMAALYLGAEVVERHFTLLPAQETKDGKISVGPKDLALLTAFSRMSRARQRFLLESLDSSWQRMLGKPLAPLSEEELLNRAYYRGRFASRRRRGRVGAAQVIFNWEETPL